MLFRAKYGAAAAVAIATAVTVLAQTGGIHLRIDDEGTRAVLETVAALSGLLATYLLVGRFRLSHLLGDLMIAYALGLLTISTLIFGVIPFGLGNDPADAARSVAPIGLGLVAAGLFAAGAWTPRRETTPAPRAALDLTVLIVATGAVLVACLRIASFAGLEPGSAVGSADTFGTTSNWAVSTCQLASALLFGVGVVGFVRRADRDQDELMAWLAAGAAFAGFSRLNYALAPSLSSHAVVPGSLMRLAFYLLLVAGAAREIVRHWRTATEVAVLEERRRIARELHDGLAQELAFIATQSRMISRRADAGERERLVLAAAERAVDESRRAIAALTRPLDEPLEVAVAQTAEEVAGRFGARVRLDLQPGIAVTPSVREALLRITREAVTNAGRHGQATRIAVALSNGDGVNLQVTDNGRGFELVDLQRGTGRFGVVSMRERAEALGGSFGVESTPYAGTSVKVQLPC